MALDLCDLVDMLEGDRSSNLASWMRTSLLNLGSLLDKVRHWWGSERELEGAIRSNGNEGG